ncbi:MAG: hypothetical protein MUC68_16785 [Burkholderiaceae bacterium]|jgi:hypothetical protein|nr:hypothetical protein [Burkholderiaceae bacterium]
MLDLLTLAIVVAALAYLGRRWFASRKGKAGCDGCGPPPRTTQKISLTRLRSSLRRR